MALAEDAASVLEQFVQDVANLPAEIAHLLEEIQAKDQAVVKLRKDINKNDTSIQQHLKSQNFNCSSPHPKDKLYCDAVCSYFDKAQAAQDEKVALGDKAALLLDRQIKRLDIKIRDLQNEGAIQPDPQLPSLLSNSSLATRLPPLSSSTTTPGANTPLHPLSGNAGGGGASTTAANNPIQRLVQPNPSHRHPSPLSTTPTNPLTSHNIAAVRANSTRSPSTDPKRRRLNPHHANLPAQSSSLRQSSLGPGTPKGGAAAAAAGLDGASRGSSAGPSTRPSKKNPSSRTNTGLASSTTATATAGSTANNSTAPHHNRVNALNASTPHPTKKSSSSSATNPTNSPSNTTTTAASAARKRTSKKSGTPASSANGMDSDTAPTATTTPRPAGGHEDEDRDARMDDVDEEAEEEEDEEGADETKYCTCKQVSYGNMVACDNERCPYEWFHWSCVGIRQEPDGKWFCPDCRVKTREGREWAGATAGGGRVKGEGR